MNEERVGSKRIKLTNAGKMQPGSLLLSATRKKSDHATASVMAYPDARLGKDSGYFLLLLSPPEPKEKKVVKREVSVVIDKSGSMAGERIARAFEAVVLLTEVLHRLGIPCEVAGSHTGRRSPARLGVRHPWRSPPARAAGPQPPAQAGNREMETWTAREL